MIDYCQFPECTQGATPKIVGGYYFCNSHKVKPKEEPMYYIVYTGGNCKYVQGPMSLDQAKLAATNIIEGKGDLSYKYYDVFICKAELQAQRVTTKVIEAN